ncbi:hypothetical protein PVL29_017210 [Vitis rotundifolia]|uniref:Uncharacterized protein n=1 Tax=Vitis rotundifolia TaxID=103349 RepID=A0AA39DI57_VITRO|nr:hypothetical protein PVL29_017210 [Vitis rotundifolia]
MTSNSNPSFDELRWVIEIRRTLDEELEEDSEVPVNIYNVPKTLMAAKPDCYVPQEVALGPYHHWRPELYEMERYKLAAAKRIQKHLQRVKFESLVDLLTRHEPRIRACYHKFLEFNGDTLAWMMAIDASFMLEFLQVYAIKAGRVLTRVSSRMSHLVDYAGTKSAHNAILRDMNEDESKEGKEGSFGDSNYVQQLFQIIWNLLSTWTQGPIRLLKRLLLSDPVKLILKLPWTIVSKLPGFSILKQPVEYIFSSQNKEENKPENGNSNSNSNIIKPPLIEEIAIPSVSELSRSGVRFLPTNGSISSITFDANMATLYLPTVSLDVNTELILRNLVAYEASNASGPLIIARYTELMNGIIDTKEDAQFLRERGIILNRLKSDEEVADLWNGMNKTIRLTKVPFLDKVIEDVNNYHTGIWQVKAGKLLKRYVFGSWQFLTFLATVCILLLMTLQAFCSVYSCPRMFNITEDQ